MTNARLTLFTLLQRDDLRTPEHLLAEALPIVVSELGGQHAQVYRITVGGVVVWHSTDDTPAGTFSTLASTSPLRQALDTRITVIDPVQHLSAVPLQADNQVFALLVIHWQTPPDLAETDLMAAILGTLLRSRELAYLLERQTAITDKLNAAESLSQIAGAIGSAVLQRGQFLSINRFEYDPEERIIGATAIASANREQSFEIQTVLGVDPAYLEMVFQALKAEGEMLISDLQTDPRLTEAGKKWLMDNQIRATYNLPLYRDQHLFAFVSIIDTRYGLAPTTEERTLYHNVVGQAASIIEKRRLLETTAATLEETRTLYGLSQDLMHSQSVPDILRVMYQYFGQDTLNISVSEFEYNEQHLLNNAYIRYLATEGRVREVNIPWFSGLSKEEQESAQEHAGTIGSQIEILEDYEQELHRVPVLRQLYEQGVRSSITIPLMEKGLRARQITLAWSRPRAFDERTRRLIETARSQIELVLRNRELLISVQRSAEESGEEAQTLALINKLIMTTNTTQNDQEVLDRAAEIIHEITGSDHVGIVLHNTRGENARVAAQYPVNAATGTQINTGARSITALLAKTRQPIVLNDVLKQDLISLASLEPLMRMGVRSTFFVPMFDLNQDLIGSVGVDYFRQQDPIDGRSVELAETVASQTAISLQKLRLLYETEQRAAQMEQIAEFSHSVQGSLQIPDILGAALNYSQDIVPHDYMAVLLYDRRDSLLKRSALDADDSRRIELPGDVVLREQNSIAYQVYEGREALRVNTLQSTWEWKHPESDRLKTLVVVPLIAGSLDLGVIEVGSLKEDAYGSADAAALTQMANQIATALGNAEAYEQSQKVARNKVLANEISTRLQRQADVNELLQTTAEELGRAVGAKRVRIRLGANQQPSREPRS